MSQLTSVTVTDFRSIRGTITVPLDAPVVLIHGQNGTGKTSLLSAIELGLTGSVPSLMRADADYVSHLVHKSSASGRVLVEASGIAQSISRAHLEIDRNRISGDSLLSGNAARFYSERCFLAQSTLSRLLEIYEDSSGQVSPLTKFVKDLLGLDSLDALIDGLYDAGDVRRFRTNVPLYLETRDSIPALKKEIESKESELTANLAAQATLTNAIRTRLEQVGLQDLLQAKDISQTADLGESIEEPALQNLSAARVEVNAARDQWQSLEVGDSKADRANLERLAGQTTSKLEEWHKSGGKVLDELIAEASKLTRDLHSYLIDGPMNALSSAIDAVDNELKRCALELAAATDSEKKALAADQEIERAKARASALDQQLAEHAADAGSLAKVLSDLLPHIHSDNCPVCGQDFGLLFEGPLDAFVSDKINKLSASAGRLQILARERAATNTAQVASERVLAQLAGVRLESSAIDALRTRESTFVELRQRLDGVRSIAAEGEALQRTASEASRKATELQSLNLRAMSIQASMLQLSRVFSIDAGAVSEPMHELLERLGSAITERMEVLFRKQAARRQTVADRRDLVAMQTRAEEIRKAIGELGARRDQLQQRQNAADILIRDAKELSKRARSARTSIVRRVFNDALNAVWRDLFVRLAPDEPFVPRFELPNKDDGPVEAILQTIYRSGDAGGNPRAVLSAGNLNTAALTLFLALHLSVAPTLPWLVIDDPVQSMDEVHIAQLAALLRTLSKVHGRQIIVAVHEKPLFDYLCLELSPAFQSDKLITIELSRSPNGDTLMSYRPLVWQPDKAIAA